MFTPTFASRILALVSVVRITQAKRRLAGSNCSLNLPTLLLAVFVLLVLPVTQAHA